MAGFSVTGVCNRAATTILSNSETMNKIIKVAVDAMGGDGSPKKIIDGIIHHYKNNKNT